MEGDRINMQRMYNGSRVLLVRVAAVNVCCVIVLCIEKVVKKACNIFSELFESVIATKLVIVLGV